MNCLKVVSIVAFLILISCQHKKQESLSESKKTTIVKGENFDVFNSQFHSDSVFQISRVDFPIDGISVSGFDRHNWTKENWKFINVPVSEKNEIQNYEHSLVKSDTLIIERFWIPDSGFEVERQFKLIKNKWFLVYYNDINL
ncbi:hypothetical protein NJT12_22190 [Flavobacterium sp. AC]|uniref:DUF4348 domain-containing protein n=1 Tax=Flavobacterium azizsancarii TaxID=2961580 RepID=A0ABT4WIL8_9FLAO|nr:hypothetical protein [Flavobacterium azizsancarii]MDA6072342.1 hypothetical protein [Flavobacterium azizsancarii]